MSDCNRRSGSTLWRPARVDLSRARNCAVLNVDSCTMGEVYENNIECILLSENSVESDFSRNAAAAGCSELNTVECEFSLTYDSGSNYAKKDEPVEKRTDVSVQLPSPPVSLQSGVILSSFEGCCF